MGSDFAQKPITNPCSLLSLYQTLWEICKNTKHPQSHPKTPHFLAWFWKWAKWTTVWAPSGQNAWKVGKTFLEVGKKNLFITCSWEISNLLSKKKFTIHRPDSYTCCPDFQNADYLQQLIQDQCYQYFKAAIPLNKVPIFIFIFVHLLCSMLYIIKRFFLNIFKGMLYTLLYSLHYICEIVLREKWYVTVLVI